MTSEERRIHLYQQITFQFRNFMPNDSNIKFLRKSFAKIISIYRINFAFTFVICTQKFIIKIYQKLIKNHIFKREVSHLLLKFASNSNTLCLPNVKINRFKDKLARGRENPN